MNTLLVFSSLVLAVPLCGASIPTFTATRIDYSLPTIPGPPPSSNLGGQLYSGSGTNFNMQATDGPPGTGTLLIPMGGSLTGPLALTDANGFPVLITGQLVLMGLHFVGYTGTGQIEFAPIRLPPGIPLSTVTEAAVATGAFTACESVDNFTCAPAIANIALDLAGNISFDIAPDVPDNLYVVTATFSGDTVVPEPSTLMSTLIALLAGLLIASRFRPVTFR